MVDTPLSTYPDRVLTDLLGHDALNRVGKLDVSALRPTGPDTSMQFNDGGVLGGDSGLLWDKTNNRLTIANDGAMGWSPTIRFDGDTTVNGGYGAVNLGTPSGVFHYGAVATTDYAVLQLDSANSQRTGGSQLLFHTAANNSREVWWTTTTTGAADSGLKDPGVAANSTVFYWDFLASHEEMPGIFSLNGVGSFKYAIDGTPVSGPPTGQLPCKFELGLNRGVEGYAMAFGMYADGSNIIQSDLAYHSTTNTIIPMLILRQRHYLNTTGVGTGTEIRFDIDTAAFNIEQAATIQVVSTDITSTSEDFDIRFKTMAGGAAMAERLRLNDAGILVPASTYANFGTTQGSGGYGIRDNAGTIEVKNSGGTWTAPGGLPLIGTGATVTASAPLLDLSQTWNNAAVIFHALRLDVTSTASDYQSTLLKLSVGGTTKTVFNRAGQLAIQGIFGTNNNADGVLGDSNVAAWRLYNVGGNDVQLDVPVSGGPILYGAAGDKWWRLPADGGIGWSSNSGPSGAGKDVYLSRDAAGILAQRNSTNTQALRVYDTYTDASNNAYLSLHYSGGNAYLQSYHQGVVGARHLYLHSHDGDVVIQSGILRPWTLGNFSLGTSSVPWRQAFLGSLTADDLSASTPALTIGQKWNNSGVVFTAMKLDITNSASDGSSLLMDLQYNAASRFKVQGSGVIANFGNGYLVVHADGGLASAYYNIRVSGIPPFFAGNAVFASHFKIGWADNTTDVSSGANLDTFLTRQGAGIIAQHNFANAQSFCVYNTYTDSSNWERGVFDWTTTANALTIGTQKLGSTSNRDVNIASASGMTRFTGANPIDIYGSQARIDGFNGGGDRKWQVSLSQFSVASDGLFTFHNGTSLASGATDLALTRAAAGVIAFGNGSAGDSSATIKAKTKAGAPVAADVPSGTWAVIRDTSGATTKLYYNNAGTLMSVALA